jgi:hypothetical protein
MNNIPIYPYGSQYNISDQIKPDQVATTNSTTANVIYVTPREYVKQIVREVIAEMLLSDLGIREGDEV